MLPCYRNLRNILQVSPTLRYFYSSSRHVYRRYLCITLTIVNISTNAARMECSQFKGHDLEMPEYIGKALKVREEDSLALVTHFLKPFFAHIIFLSWSSCWTSCRGMSERKNKNTHEYVEGVFFLYTLKKEYRRRSFCITRVISWFPLH